MKTATKKFPFEIMENNITLPNYTVSNEDTKLSFFEVISSQSETIADLSLELCKDKFIEFYEYFQIDTDQAKNYFIMDLNIDGEVREFTVDLISNITAKFSGNIVALDFKIAII